MERRPLPAEAEILPILPDAPSSLDYGLSFTLYKRRWVLLLGLCVINFSNSSIWLSYAPIANKAAEFYDTDFGNIDVFSLVYLIAFIPVTFPATWLIDTKGLKAAMLLGSLLNTTGAVVRMASSWLPTPWMFPIAMLGQVMCAFSQPVIVSSPTKLAAVWFGNHERATANTLASAANPLGMLIAGLLSPFIVTDVSNMPLLLGVYVAPATLGTLIIVGFFSVWPPSEPPTPPTLSAAEESEPFKDGVKALLRCKPYIILLVTFGAGIGLLSALQTLLEQMLCIRGYDDKLAGICVAAMTGAGLVGAGIAGVALDKTKRYEDIMKLCFGLAGVFGILIAVSSTFYDAAVLVVLANAGFGFFAIPLLPVCLELGVECTYPVAEATSGGLLFASGQIQGIVYILVLKLLGQKPSAHELVVQNCAKLNGGSTADPQDMTISAMVFASLVAIAAVVTIAFFHTPYFRLLADKGRMEQPDHIKRDTSVENIAKLTEGGTQ